MQPGFDPLGLGGFSAGAMPNYAPPKPQPKKSKKGSGNQNPLTAFISELSGAGGAAGGAALGTLLLPGVGTVLGGLAGGFLGGATGKGLENRVRDNEYRPEDAIKEGLISGLFGGGPINTAKLAFKGGQAALGGGAKTAARTGALSLDDVMTQPIEQAAKTSTQGKLTSLGNKMLTNQYGTISKPMARATNPEDTFGELANYGLTKPEDVERVAGMFTGSGGIVNKAVLKAVGSGKRVDTSGVQQVFDDAVQINGLVDKDAQSVRNVFRAQMGKLLGGPQGSIRPDSDPSDVLDVMKALEKRAADLTGKGKNYRLSTPERMDQAKTLMAVRDELQDRLYANADVKQVLTPELREQLVRLQPDNPQWQQYIDTSVMKSGDIGKLRSTMAPFVRARQVIDEADTNSMTFGGRAGNAALGLGAGTAAGGLMGGIAAPITGMLAGAAQSAAQNPLSRGAANVLRRAGQPRMTASPMAGITASTPKQAASRVAVSGLGMGALNAGQSTDPTTLEEALQGDVLPGGMPMGGDGASMQPEVPQSPYSRDNLMADLQRDPKNADKYIEYYNALEEIFNPDLEDSKLGATARTSLANSDNAVNTLDQLQQMFTQTGGGSGKLGGAVQNKLGGLGFNDQAATYNALSASSSSQLARAVNGGGQVTDADAAVIIKALPQLTDSPEVAAAKFAALRQRLQTAHNNTLLYGSGGGTSLEDALAAQ